MSDAASPAVFVNHTPSVASVESELDGVARMQLPAAEANETPSASAPLVVSVAWRLDDAPADEPREIRRGVGIARRFDRDERIDRVGPDRSIGRLERIRRPGEIDDVPVPIDAEFPDGRGAVVARPRRHEGDPQLVVPLRGRRRREVAQRELDVVRRRRLHAVVVVVSASRDKHENAEERSRERKPSKASEH